MKMATSATSGSCTYRLWACCLIQHLQLHAQVCLMRFITASQNWHHYHLHFLAEEKLRCREVTDPVPPSWLVEELGFETTSSRLQTLLS